MQAINTLAEIKIRLDRGNGLVLWLRNLILIVAGLKIILGTTTIETIALGIFAIIVIYFLGWLDLNYIRLFQKENELNTSKYNPHLNQLTKIDYLVHDPKAKRARRMKGGNLK